MAKSKTYEEFVEKFKPKLTTDDCYTPKKVYDAVLEWVIKEYKIDKNKVVRPFYPGGDFENFDYSNGAVVVDNPPFSIMQKIKDFYTNNKIPFFLFGDGLTLFSSNDKNVCYIVTGSQITYENGAHISTSFVTNLDKYRIRCCPDLNKAIEKANKKESKKGIKTYPINLLSSTLLHKYVTSGLDLKISEEQLYFVKKLDNQVEYKKKIFGSGYLVSDSVAEKLKSIYENKINPNIEKWELSQREKEIIRGLK